MMQRCYSYGQLIVEKQKNEAELIGLIFTVKLKKSLLDKCTNFTQTGFILSVQYTQTQAKH